MDMLICKLKSLMIRNSSLVALALALALALAVPRAGTLRELRPAEGREKGRVEGGAVHAANAEPWRPSCLPCHLHFDC